MKKSAINIKIYRLRTVIILFVPVLLSGRLSAQTVTKQLYLSDGLTLDRVDPVASGDGTTASSVDIIKSPVTFVSKANTCFTTSNNCNNGSTFGSQTLAYTVAAGTDRLLVVSIGVSKPAVAVNGVTFNGTLLTKDTTIQTGDAKIELWYLLLGTSSTATSGNVVATWNSGSLLEGVMAVSDYTGVNQASPIKARTALSGTGNSASVSVSTTPGDLVIDAIAKTGNAPNIGANQVSIASDGTNSVKQASSYEIATTSTTTMSWGFTSSENYAIIAVALDGGGTTVSWNQSPALCSSLTIPANSTITVTGYFQVTAGTMPNPLTANAQLVYGSNRIINLTSATASATGGVGTTGTLTWSGSTGSLPITIPAGQSIVLNVSNENTNVQFKIDHDSQTKPSKIDIPTSTYINVDNFAVYSAADPGGSLLTRVNSGTTVYPRAVVSDPFGPTDITSAEFIYAPGGSATAMTQVATSGCTKTYEYAWTPSTSGDFTLTATAKEGLENTVTHSKTANFSVCPITVSASMTTAPTCSSPNSGVITWSVSDGAGPYTVNYLPATGTVTGSTITGLAAGTYNITITSNAGCTGTASVVVTAPSAPTVGGTITNVACKGALTGAINITASGGTAPYTYSWGSGVTTEDRTALSAGTYTVTVTDASSCTATSSFMVTEPATLLTVTVAGTTNLTCNGSGNGAIDITASNGGTSYTYLWSSGAVTEDLSSLAAGTYTVTVTDNNGCVKTASATITQPAAIMLGTSVTNVLCYGLSTGAIDLTASGGTGALSFNWGGGVTTEDRTALAAGTYTVTVTDASGCATNTPATVTQPAAALDASAVIVNVKCFGNSTGTITQTVSGGTSPYMYAWGGSTLTTKDRTGLSAGNYTITITDAASCPLIKTYTVTQPAAALNISNVAPVNPTCVQNDGTISLTVADGTSPYTFLWSNGYLAEDIAGLTSGTYSVTVSDLNACTTTASVTLATPYCPASPTATDDSYASPVDLPITGNVGSNDVDGDTPLGSLTFTLLETPNASTEGTLSFNTSDGSFTFSPVSGFIGILYLDYRVCDPGSLCDVGELRLESYPPAFHTVCSNIADYVFSVDPDPMVDTYTWTVPAGAVIVSGQNTPSIVVNFTGITNTTYNYVCARSVNVCGQSNVTCQAVKVQVVNPAITITQACSGDDILLSASAANASAYAWSGPAGFFSSAQNTAVYNATSANSGTYTVTVTDNEGCIGTRTASASVEPVPTAAVISTNADCGQANGSVNLTVTGGTTPFTYRWSSGHTTEDISVLYSGAYGVTVTDAKGCTDVANSAIVDNSGPTLTATGSNASCNGTADADIQLDVTGGVSPYTYLWSNGVVVEDLVNVADGTYTVSVTDNAGCEAYAVVTLTEPDPLRVDFTQTDILCNGQTNGAIDLTVGGGTSPYTYTWSDGPSTQDRTGLASGTYTVTVADGGNCSSIITFSITQPQVLVISGTTDNNTCGGGNRGAISLTPSGGTTPYTYLWSGPAATTPYLSYLTAGSYTVTVTDDNGCTKTAAYTITSPSAIGLSAVPTAVSCNGGTTGAVDLTVTGGTSSFTYQWSNGAISQDLSSVRAGTYTVFVADANNCTSTANYTVTEPSALSLAGTTQNVSCHGGANGVVDITVSGGTPGYTYLWSNAATTQDLSATGAGDYSVTATDTKGCTIVGGIFSVTEPLLLNVDAALTDVACNGGMTGGVNITPFGGTSPYTYLWSNAAVTQDITSVGAGTYTVTVTDFKSCTDVHTYTVAQPAALTLMLTGANSTCNGSNDGMVVSAVGGGVTPYAYSWSSGQVASSISNRAPGTYGLTVTDYRGCQISSSKVLTEPAVIVVTDMVTNVSCSGGNSGSIDIGVTGGTTPYSYLWSNGATTQDLASLKSINYSVTVTDSNGCVKDASYSVTEPSAISFSATSVNPLCNGGTNGSIDLTVSGGTPSGTAPLYTYLWSGGQTVEDPSGLAAGTHTVTVTDANSCTAVFSISLSEPDALAATSIKENSSCYLANDGTVEVFVSGGTTPYTYSWTGGAATEAISGLSPGTYTVTIQDANVCQITRSYTITEPVVLTAGATATNIDCYGNANGAIDLTAGGGTSGYSYFWSNGSTTEDLSALGAGTYEVTVSDANNCTKTASATVSEPSVLGASVAVSPVSCFGGMNGATAAVPSGGTSPYTYAWSSGSATTYNLTGLGTGTFTVTVTDAEGCTSSSSGLVTAPSAAVAITDTINTPPCSNLNGGSVKIGITGGTPDYTYLWSDSSTNEDLTGVASGTYSVTVTDFRGCTVTGSYNVPTPTCNQPPVAVFETKTTLENTPVTICIHTNDTDPDNNLDTSTTTITVQPLHGTVVKTSTPGCWKYTPNTNYDGTDRFVYNVCDTGLPVYCDTAIVYITITPLVADLAIDKTSTASTYTAGNTVTWTITVTNNGPNDAVAALVNDDINNSLTSVSWTAAVNGSATVVNSSGTGDITNESVTIPAGSGNSVVYTVTATVPGSFTGNLVNTAVVTAPFGTTDPDPTDNSDSETDIPAPVSDLAIVKTSAPNTFELGGMVTWIITVTNAGPSDVTGALINDDINNSLTGVSWSAMAVGNSSVSSTSGAGDLINIPVSIAAGTGNSIKFTVTGTVPAGFTGLLSNTATVDVPVGTTDPDNTDNSDDETDTPVPVVADDLYLTPYDTNVTGDVSDNDVFEPNSTFDNISDPVNGGLVFNSDGTFTYNPDMFFSGIDTFSYHSCLPAPNHTTCDTAFVTIVVGPYARKDYEVTPHNTPFTSRVDTNDIFMTGSMFAVLVNPPNGTLVLNPDGSYTYTPNNGYSGWDTFTYVVCLPAPYQSLCDTAITIIAVGPKATDDLYVVPHTDMVTGSVSPNDTYPPGSDYSVVDLPPLGGLTLDMNTGTFVYTPPPDFSGIVTFFCAICFNPCDTAKVTIVVGPRAMDDYEVTPHATPVTSDVYENDFFRRVRIS